MFDFVLFAVFFAVILPPSALETLSKFLLYIINFLKILRHLIARCIGIFVNVIDFV